LRPGETVASSGTFSGAVRATIRTTVRGGQPVDNTAFRLAPTFAALIPQGCQSGLCPYVVKGTATNTSSVSQRLHNFYFISNEGISGQGVTEPFGRPAGPGQTIGWTGSVWATSLVSAKQVTPLVQSHSAGTSPIFTFPPAQGGPDWFPLRGNHEIGCTMSNPSPPQPSADNCDGYHPWAALDIDAARYEAVYSAGHGTVSRTGTSWVTIRHPNGQFSYYEHLSAVAVRPGDRVIPDSILGSAGDVGSAGYVHLHFEVNARDAFGPSLGARTYPNGLPLRSCIGWVRKTYPSALGYAQWSTVPRNTVIAAELTTC
jgi:hypothetical protein